MLFNLVKENMIFLTSLIISNTCKLSLLVLKYQKYHKMAKLKLDHLHSKLAKFNKIDDFWGPKSKEYNIMKLNNNN